MIPISDHNWVVMTTATAYYLQLRSGHRLPKWRLISFSECMPSSEDTHAHIDSNHDQTFMHVTYRVWLAISHKALY